MSKLDDIFIGLHRQYEMEFGMHKQDFDKTKAKQQVKNMMLEVYDQALQQYIDHQADNLDRAFARVVEEL